ncbi:2-amino-4-hydroxy-6-hydroxymethyldihydropteridine diphosphokinase [Desulfuribacillus alkaliarsenatis]|uniref:Bifunctional folate synthesis protein n=1 Tax=Desulfuribacillus alkaliarsenatis TaxID=766136 RepID=A0A1E5FZY6_9FIRM|nr:2-amino-4-hydroxy-6-hydroxymethyldihydropteridine diphosphokinase [Desulfuribacillus alkaliarsenatis]OEF95796.1 hypothetical protein BHF68_11925 [Desulfuribacillus alkaliarsenatis]
MDKIIMKDMQFYGRHGVLKEEEQLGQPFIVNIELYGNLQEAGKTDDLEHTINYGQVYLGVKEIVENRRFQLIEALAEAIASEILNVYDKVLKLKVQIQKPQAPIAGVFAYMGVEIIRAREATMAYLALGSNIGNRAMYIKQAIAAIDNLDACKVIDKASIYETKPQGNVNQADFLNTAIKVETTYAPSELLKQLQNIESKLHRVRTEKWGPRTIDIDILFYGQECIETVDLIIPHPRLEERDFVLTPMLELAPYLFHPRLNSTIEELHRKLTTNTANKFA